MLLRPSFSDLDPLRDDYAPAVVDRLLEAAISAGVSDIHLEQTPQGIQLRWRLDGNLLDLGVVADGRSTHILGRVKAVARLITYRYDIPQEGRLTFANRQLEARVGTLPTLHGERAVIRLIAARTNDWLPHQLGLAAETLSQLQQNLLAPSGVIIISGIANAGKTTTAYACLRHILSESTQRSVVSLEDPIEAELPGAAQSQINPSVGYDWSLGLKALLRQDPEVMLVGEIRDAETAAVVFQAALTGQLVLSTLHARSAADAVRRLLDLQVPAHQLCSGLNLLLCQRLVRAACPQCAATGSTAATADDLSASPICPVCGGTGGAGRSLLAERLPGIEAELARAIMNDADAASLQAAANALGMRSLASQAAEGVAQGRLPPTELNRL